MFNKIIKKWWQNICVLLLFHWWSNGLKFTSAIREGSLPRLMQTQDGYIIETALRSSEQDIHLEDFFWTGSGDGSPNYGRKPNMAVSETDPRGTIIKTTTVLATVYVDSNMDTSTDPLCLYDCSDDIGYPADYSPADRRYWLLTIVAGYLQPQDFPIIEQKLAKLYRIAFTRQQSWHLGIGNNETFHSHSDRRKREINVTKSIVPTRTLSYDKSLTIKYASFHKNDNPEKNRLMNRKRRDILNSTSILSSEDNKENIRIVPRPKTENEQGGINVPKVSVLVHNISLLNEMDETNSNNNSTVSKDTAMLNQTEIIYSVFVDGKPVLATTAAEDMKLVTTTEVSKIMEKLIYTKAEPYIKEPQATPLIPATSTSNQNSNLIAVFTENPIMLIIGTAMLLIIVVLLVGFLLMTRAKKRRSAEIKRLTARRALIGDEQNNRDGTEPMKTVKSDSDDDGIVNLSYAQSHENLQDSMEKKKTNNGDAVIHFPRPPSISPSSSTSDSSIYYPPRRSRLDIQNILDEKPVNFFKKKNKTNVESTHDQDAAPYAAIVKTKKERKPKTKRKYLSENRVGSIEGDEQIRTPTSSSGSDIFDISDTNKVSHYYEHIETYNPNVKRNYHQNKLLTNSTFLQKMTGDGVESPPEPYDQEIMNVLRKEHHHQHSPGSGSIGSFLSMASVRSFPKCTVPEPLSRVLEPVSVTHLDHTEESSDSSRKPAIVGAKYKSMEPTKNTTRLAKQFEIEAAADAHLCRSQSDGADPGVIGPAVWKFQKNLIEYNSNSPVRDPIQTRNRFEGLLEGAIKLYSNDSKNSVDQSNDMPGAIRSKDTRGKSAATSGILKRSNSGHLNRPVTAGPSNTRPVYSTEPPSPSRRAWGSGAPSPLVRPLSAGPFHRPEAPIIDVTRVLAPHNPSTVSAAPLIEAIQNELKKFNTESHA